MNNIVTKAKGTREGNGFGSIGVKKQTMKTNPVKKEESEDEHPDRSFETIFLPNVYEGVQMETTFFDINKYKVNYGFSTEGCEVRTNITNCPNVYNSSGNQHFKSEARQMNNEYVYFPSPVTTTFPHFYADKINSIIQERECNGGVPINNIHVNFNFYQQTPQGYVNKHTEGYMYQGSNIPEEYNNLNLSSISRFVNTRPIIIDPNIIDVDNDVEIVSVETKNCRTPLDNKRAQTVIERPVQLEAALNTSSSSNIPQVTNTRPAPYKKSNKIDFYGTKKNSTENDDKYKCPICKRPRLFSTLTAVNNHLKFEHISVFPNSNAKLLLGNLPMEKEVSVQGIELNPT